MPRIWLSAGETSGDRLGAGLARALLARRPDLELVGMGGREMAEAGVRLLQDSHEVSVTGLLEVVRHLPAIRRIKKRLVAELERQPPDLLVPIDFPDFNLRIAADAGRLGIPVVYYVSPQVWAWRRGRLRRIRELVRRMLVLFPFETGFYERAGVPVTFVGNPVALRGGTDRSAAELLAGAGLEGEGSVVALVPGSRVGEVRRMLPVMLDAARLLQQVRPGLRFLLTVAPGLDRDKLESTVDRSGLDRVALHEGDFPEVLSPCAAGLVTAGTASLEAAMVGLPMVVVYRMNPLSYLLGRLLVRVENVALPNLVAGRRIVPELIQGGCRPHAVAAELARFLDDPVRAARVRRELSELRTKLAGEGAYERAAEAVLAELAAGRSAD